MLWKILRLVCPIAYALCLTIAYAQVGQWLVLGIVLLTFFIWLFTHWRPSSELSTTALVISVGLAAAGLLAGTLPFLMMLGATFALASWDLALWEHTQSGIFNSPAKTVVLFGRRHFQSLALALGLGLLAALAGPIIHFQLPLGGMILLVIAALFSLDRVWHALLD